MIKIGILGGHILLETHVQVLLDLEGCELIGFYESDEKIASNITNKYNVRRFEHPDELLAAVDAIDSLLPAPFNFGIPFKAVRSSRHVFTINPFASSLAEAKELIGLAREANIKFQLSNSHRYNSAYNKARDYDLKPSFIETHHLYKLDQQQMKKSVIFDMMLNDIDITLNLVKSNVKKVSASGISILSKEPDLVNARIEFDNGTVAILTTSRVSMTNMHKTRFFQNKSYIAVDFVENGVEYIRVGQSEMKQLNMWTEEDYKKDLNQHLYNIGSSNPIRTELTKFIHCIKNDKVPEVSIHEGYDAMRIAQLISEKINLNISE